MSSTSDFNVYLWCCICTGGRIRDELFTLYNNKCAASGSSFKVLLEVGWIEKTLGDEELSGDKDKYYGINNALLLTSELHTLFDLYYWTLSDQYEIILSDALLNTSNDNSNCEHITALDGKRIQLPENNSARPTLDHIHHHRLIALKLYEYTKSIVQTK